MMNNTRFNIFVTLSFVAASVSAGAQILIDEDFSTGNGLLPPAGWASTLVMGNDPMQDGWRWDNPGTVTVNNPMVEPTAICNSDASGSANMVVAQLDSPTFDASSSGSLPIMLSWDQFHRPLNSTVEVFVSDGTNLNSVYFDAAGTNDPDAVSLDIAAAAGGASNAFLRFEYTGNFDWWWLVDNVVVSVPVPGLGQAPKPGVASLDINGCVDANGLPVSSGINGPYYGGASTPGTMTATFEGLPNQPVVFFTGNLNVSAGTFAAIGQLDVGDFDVTNGFQNISVIGSGLDPGFLNALFFTDLNGIAQLTFSIPAMAPVLVGFQSYVYALPGLGFLTNAVEVAFQ